MAERRSRGRPRRSTRLEPNSNVFIPPDEDNETRQDSLPGAFNSVFGNVVPTAQAVPSPTPFACKYEGCNEAFSQSSNRSRHYIVCPVRLVERRVLLVFNLELLLEEVAQGTDDATLRAQIRVLDLYREDKKGFIELFETFQKEESLKILPLLNDFKSLYAQLKKSSSDSAVILRQKMVLCNDATNITGTLSLGGLHTTKTTVVESLTRELTNTTDNHRVQMQASVILFV